MGWCSPTRCANRTRSTTRSCARSSGAIPPPPSSDTSFRHVQHGKQRMFAAFDKLSLASDPARAGEAHNRTIE